MATISQIKLPDNVTYELAPKEENIKWGGYNVIGSVSPIGMSLSADHSANRLAFINGDLLSVEGSTDNGNTWTDYGLSKGAKTTFCTSGQNIHIGTNSAEACTLNSKLRITLTAQNGDSPSNTVYTNPKKLLVNVSTANGLEVLVEVRTGTNYLNNGAWDKFGTYTVSGWSGWNDIPLILGTLGGGSTQTGNYWQLRLTFSVTRLHSSEQYRSICYVTAIRIYGDNTWTTPSNMARHNHIYNYDYAQNTTFPANVTAPKFIGALQGNADTATNATKVNNHTVNKDVPSDAVFTDEKVLQDVADDTVVNFHPIILSNSTSASAVTNKVQKTTNLTYSPAERYIKIVDGNKYMLVGADDIYRNGGAGVYETLADKANTSDMMIYLGDKAETNASNIVKSDYIEKLGIEETPAFEEEVLTTTTAESVETGTHTTIMSLALSKGTWQISATALFASNATGYRHAYIADSSSSTSAFNSMMASSNAVDGMVTALNFGRAVVLSSSTTIYLRVRHNRGSNLNVYGRLTAVRLNATA